MNAKVLMLFIAVVAVGLFAMPSTVSLISGQHTFINYTDGGQSCDSCHSGVGTTSGGAHVGSGWNTSTGANDACRGCHVPGAVVDQVIPANISGDNLTSLSTDYLHIARAVRCVTCHDAAANMTGGSSIDAHKPLHDNATSGDVTKIASEDRACITCHTAASTKEFGALNSSAAYTVNVTKPGGNWSVIYS